MTDLLSQNKIKGVELQNRDLCSKIKKGVELQIIAVFCGRASDPFSHQDLELRQRLFDNPEK